VDNSTFSAEYGRNSGAIVNVATRSGANQMRGEAFDFYRDERFDSRNYFNPASLDTAGNVTPQSLFNRKQFGAKLGGALVKNRSFFFGSYEGLRHEQGVDLNSGTLTDAQRAGVTDPLAKDLLAYIPSANDLTGTRDISSPLAPVTIDQYTIDSRNNLRQGDDLHVYYGQRTRCVTPRDGWCRASRTGAADIVNHDGQRDAHLRSGVRQRVRGDSTGSASRSSRRRSTRTLGINVGLTASPCRRARVTISGLGLNQRPAHSRRPRGDDVCGRRRQPRQADISSARSVG
jgi:hypothetical protein